MNNHKIKIRKTKYRTNRGMSMLEVIIAVSVFSVAAAILLQGFVTSGRINKKSGLYLEATTIAQNVMEEIKAKSFEEVSLAFNYPIDHKDNKTRLQFLNSQHSNVQNKTLDVFEALPGTNQSTGSMEYHKVIQYNTEFGDDTSRVTASVISKNDGNTYEANPRTTGVNASKYYFVLNNVKNDNETFDVLVEFDGSASSGYKKQRGMSGSKDEKNDYLSPNISQLDTKTNAFFSLDRNVKIREYVEQMVGVTGGEGSNQHEIAKKLWQSKKESFVKEKEDAAKAANPDITPEQLAAVTSQAIADFAAANPEPDYLNVDEVMKKTKLRLTLTVDKEANGIVTVTADYKVSAYDYDNSSQSGMEWDTIKNLCPCHGNGMKQDDPIEGCFCTKTGSSTVVYSSETDTTLENVYMFYEPNYDSSRAGILDEIILDNQDNQDIQFYLIKQKDDKVTSTQENSYYMSLTVREQAGEIKNNWNTNPGQFRSMTKLRTNLNYDISNEQVLDRPKITQMNVTYIDPDTSRKQTGSNALTILSMNGLDNRQEKDRIYTVKVGVYKHKEVSEQSFLESDLIVSLDGSKEN